MLTAAVVAVVTAVVVASLLGSTPPTLVVESISVASLPPKQPNVACPARFAIIGTVVTNGTRGILRFQWFGEQSIDRRMRSVSVGAGTREIKTGETAFVDSAAPSTTVGLRMIGMSTPTNGSVSIDLHCAG